MERSLVVPDWSSFYIYFPSTVGVLQYFFLFPISNGAQVIKCRS